MSASVLPYSSPAYSSSTYSTSSYIPGYSEADTIAFNKRFHDCDELEFSDYVSPDFVHRKRPKLQDTDMTDFNTDVAMKRPNDAHEDERLSFKRRRKSPAELKYESNSEKSMIISRVFGSVTEPVESSENQMALIPYTQQRPSFNENFSTSVIVAPQLPPVIYLPPLHQPRLTDESCLPSGSVRRSSTSSATEMSLIAL